MTCSTCGGPASKMKCPVCGMEIDANDTSHHHEGASGKMSPVCDTCGHVETECTCAPKNKE